MRVDPHTEEAALDQARHAVTDLAAVVPDALSAGTFALLVALSAVTSFITAAFGLGGGALLLAAMAVLMPPAALIPVHGVVQLGSNAGRMLMLRHWIDWRHATAFAVGSVIGASAGGLVAIELPGAVVEIAVGGFLLWIVFARPPAWLARQAGVTGAVSSFLTMFFGATGPFVAGYVKALGLERRAHVATHATFMTLQHSLKVAVFGLLGFTFSEWAVLALAMIASGAIGIAVGKALLTRLTDQIFQRVLSTILVLIALRLIWSGVSAL